MVAITIRNRRTDPILETTTHTMEKNTMLCIGCARFPIARIVVSIEAQCQDMSLGRLCRNHDLQAVVEPSTPSIPALIGISEIQFNKKLDLCSPYSQQPLRRGDRLPRPTTTRQIGRTTENERGSGNQNDAEKADHLRRRKKRHKLVGRTKVRIII